MFLPCQALGTKTFRADVASCLQPQKEGLGYMDQVSPGPSGTAQAHHVSRERTVGPGALWGRSCPWELAQGRRENLKTPVPAGSDLQGCRQDCLQHLQGLGQKERAGP